MPEIATAVAAEPQTSASGLSPRQAAARLERDGPNSIPSVPPSPLRVRLARQGFAAVVADRRLHPGSARAPTRRAWR